jgi:hypothetical protein
MAAARFQSMPGEFGNGGLQMNSANCRIVKLRAGGLLFAIVTALIFSAHRGFPAPTAPYPMIGHRASNEGPFLAENDAAMIKMMSGMAVKTTGDVDADFVAMMVPHHQGAIDMALAVLRYGRNPRIKRLAQEIIVTQQQEIAAMRLAVGEPLPPSIASPTQPSAGSEVDHQPMSHGSMKPGSMSGWRMPTLWRRSTH